LARDMNYLLGNWKLAWGCSSLYNIIWAHGKTIE
jgi:hypothetical protein